MHKILFLDVDGVLNTTGRYFSRDFNPEAMANLKRVLDTTGAYVVVISQWRLDSRDMWDLGKLFEEHGISSKLIKGGTRQIDLHSRNREIRSYLIYVQLPAVFAIVDDTPGYFGNDAFIMSKAVFTDKLTGLTSELADQLIEKLDEKNAIGLLK